ncbi:MAG: metal ABC transporter permease [Spirochaetes bacterium]|jgi:zinc transport system permease protein|nr:metal ABC transporter permease [Spirochaetota bacterium]
MTELLGMRFFTNALVMCLLLSFLFGTLSFFVVMRRMSFLGAGVSHAAFGGVAIGILLGIDPFYTSFVFCTLSAVLLGKLVKSGNISYDTGIGILFSFSMALGAIFIALKKKYTFDLMGYLFGNILGVTSFDMMVSLATTAVFIPFIFACMHKILFMTFDEEVAAVSGVRTGLLDTVMLIFLAAIIVISIKIVGIILISALVVLPASFGILLTKNYRRVIAAGIAYTLAIMVGGLLLSYYLDLPTGATIVSLGTAVYFVFIGLNAVKRSH